MSQSYSPIGLSERVHEIDAVRGFALLGILMMNIMSFAGPTLQDQFTAGTSDIYTGGANAGVIFFINTFVTSNFYTMFSFLFGLGFYIFLSRAEKKPGSTSLLFLRRMMMLLAFGLFHAIFIWYGDILMVYAATGSILLIFYKFKPFVNLAVSSFILLLGTLFVVAMSLLLFAAGSALMSGDQGFNPGFDMVRSLTDADYMDVLDLNMSVFGTMMSSNIMMIPFVLAMFLIGLYAGQKRIFENLDAKRKLLVWTAAVGIGAGTPIKILVGYGLTYMMDEPAWSILTMLAYTLGGPLMSLGYVAFFILIVLKFKGLTKMLQPVGQMALTNYIMQSVLMTVFFYGMNMFNEIDAVWFIPIVLIVFAVQTVYSHLWMKKFKSGPLEWIWRSVTYGRIMPIKR